LNKKIFGSALIFSILIIFLAYEPLAYAQEDENILEGKEKWVRVSSEGTDSFNLRLEDESTFMKMAISDPTAGESLTIDLFFIDFKTAQTKEHVNYDITVKQNDKTVLSNMGVHEDIGSIQLVTSTLDTGEPVDIEITILGFGLPGDEENWTGVKGEVVTFTAVPEFGQIVMLILGASILTIIYLTSKHGLRLNYIK